MSVNNKRRRVKIGDIFAIDLGGNKYGYGRLLKSPLMEFYDFQSNGIAEDLSIILNNDTIFKVWVMKYAFKSEKWHYIGNVELKNKLEERVLFFKQDHFDYTFSIYYSENNQGIEIPGTYEDVKNLERAAVWDAKHVEDRLRDYFNGVPNVWVEQLKPKLLKS